MERDLDGVHSQAEQLGDLFGGQVGAVAERDELAVAEAEGCHRGLHRQPVDVVEGAARILGQFVDRLVRQPGRFAVPVGDAAARNSEEPGDRRPLVGPVIALVMSSASVPSPTT